MEEKLIEIKTLLEKLQHRIHTKKHTYFRALEREIDYILMKVEAWL